MTKIEVKREFPGMSTDECFRICVSLIDKLGYKLFKKRDIANLIICNGVVENARVDLSIMISFDSPTSISLNLSSDDLDESILLNESDRILNLITTNLLGK